jgi:putative heme-binding domain-containing protein
MRFGICLLAALGLAAALEAQSPEHGRRLFESQCALCHGQDGKGGRGPSLAVPTLTHAPNDQALADVIRKGIPGTEMPGAWQLNAREVEAVSAFVRTLGNVPVERLPGDPHRGAQLFQSKGCNFCHIVSGQGVGYGPELTEIGKRRSAAYLRDSMIKPAADIPEAFLLVEVSAPEGKVRGLRVNEDSFTIQLKDANQAFHSFRKTALKELKKLTEESPMPSYEKRLSTAELDDLVAYLASLRGQS